MDDPQENKKMNSQMVTLRMPPILHRRMVAAVRAGAFGVENDDQFICRAVARMLDTFDRTGDRGERALF